MRSLVNLANASKYPFVGNQNIEQVLGRLSLVQKTEQILPEHDVCLENVRMDWYGPDAKIDTDVGSGNTFLLVSQSHSISKAEWGEGEGACKSQLFQPKKIPW